MIGLPKGTSVFDDFNNELSRTTQEYEMPTKGVLKNKNAVYFDYSYGGGEAPPIPCNPRVLNVSDLFVHPYRVKKKISVSQLGKKTIEYSNFDEIIGRPLTIITTSEDGKISQSDSKPAFRVYEQMGPKSIDVAKDNYLVASVSAVQSITNVANNYNGIISDYVSTYHKDYEVREYDVSTNKFKVITKSKGWHHSDKFIWNGEREDGFLGAGYSAFDFVTPANNSDDWESVINTELYDNKGHLLEVGNKNNEYSAFKFNHTQDVKVCKGMNTNYESFTFTGFEYEAIASTLPSGADVIYYEGEVLKGDNAIQTQGNSTRESHTGHYYLKVPPLENGGTFTASTNNIDGEGTLLNNRDYVASCWVHQDSPDDISLSVTLNGINSETIRIVDVYALAEKSDATIVSGEWLLLKVEFTVPENYISREYGINSLSVKIVNNSSTQDAFVDDFMVRPSHASVDAYIFDQDNDLLINQINSKNYASKSEYDDKGNLIRYWQELPNVGFKLIKEKQYNYSRNF